VSEEFSEPSLDQLVALEQALKAEEGHHGRDEVLGIGVAGLLISTAQGDAVERLDARLDDIDVPVVLMERAFGFPQVAREYDHVRTDHAYGALLALRHFAALGHRRIAVNLQATVTAYWLRRGIETAAKALDIEVFLSPVDLPARGDDPGAAAQLDAFLAECESFGSRAVLVHSDEHGASLVERAMELGLRVPEDLAVIAYNDVTASLAVVPLTAVCPPRRTLGETACDLLLRKLQHPTTPVQHLSLLPTLNIRTSCGTPDR
jgi:DNA-binding LacI/PurR family transcriptional regulator